MQRFKPEPRNRFEAKLWAKAFLRPTDCNVQHGIGTAVSAATGQCAIPTCSARAPRRTYWFALAALKAFLPLATAARFAAHIYFFEMK